MIAKIVGKKIVNSTDKKTGELKEFAFLYYTSKFGKMMSSGTVTDGFETGDLYVSAEDARQIPVGASVSLDFDKRGYLQNLELIENGGGK